MSINNMLTDAWNKARELWLSYPACSVCRSSIKGRAEPLGLCRTCFQTIPWIKHVQCFKCGRGIVCTDCERRQSTFFQQNRSAVRYDDHMKEWLALWKYRGDERLQVVLSGMLVHPYNLYREQGITFDGITFVPVSSTRYEERGFNQAEKLAKGLGQRVRLPVIPMLNRVLHTNKQSVKSRMERITDLHTAFEMRPNIPLVKANSTMRRILLVDDVYTTGSTLNQCAKILTSDNQLDIYGLTWAR